MKSPKPYNPQDKTVTSTSDKSENNCNKSFIESLEETLGGLFVVLCDTEADVKTLQICIKEASQRAVSLIETKVIKIPNPKGVDETCGKLIAQSQRSILREEHHE